MHNLQANPSAKISQNARRKRSNEVRRSRGARVRDLNTSADYAASDPTASRL